MPPGLSAHTGREGRYVIGEEIAAGGMATVHLGRMLGDAGFARTVAIKRLHPQYAKDPDFAAMLLDEGRLASRIQHVNVVPTLDVVASGGDLFMVMEYVHGEPLHKLLRAVVRARSRIPPRLAAGIVAGALRGLHAAHEARDAHGRLLGVVHRDVSPQNIIVGADGVPRVLDFGIAKAAGRAHTTQTGQIKGKFAYMPPEQLHGEELDRRADIYAAGVVLWESLVGARLFAGADQAPNLGKLLDPHVEPPSTRAPGIDAAYDAVALRALARAKEARFATALEMAEALEACAPVATAAEIGAWVQATAGEALAERAARIAAVEKELAQRIRDSLDYLEAIEETITDVVDLPLPPLPAAWMERAAARPSDEIPTLPSAKGGPLAAAPLLDEVTTVPSAKAVPPVEAAPSPVEAAPLPVEAAPLPPETAPSPPEAASLPPPAKGLPVAWIGLAVVGALLVIGTAALVGRGRPVTATAPTASASVTSSASAPPPEPPTASASAPAPEPEPPPPAPPAASASARPSAPPRPARPRPPEPSCSPPFTIDAAGHKHYKRECLR
jgi:serine/threonine-protein kinase